MPKTILEIRDECNIKFHDLDIATRRKFVQAVEFFVPYARHMPSYKLGRWNGKVAFATQGATSYLNLLEKLIPVVEAAGYEIELVDRRPYYGFEFEDIDENYLADVKWPKGHRLEGQGIKLEPHQVGAINCFGQHLQAIQELSTGAGKTITSASLSRRVEKYGRSIIIVPNKDLVKQTEADYKLVGLDTGVFFGDRKEFGHTHTVCTWQSLARLDQNSKDGLSEVEISEFIDGVVCVMVDECHTGKAEVLQKLLTGAFRNIPIRWGFTGTVPKEDWEFFPILCSLGPIVNRVTPKELQDLGFLANIHVNICQFLDTVGFDDWQSELKFLTTDDRRIGFIAGFIQEIAEQDGNTLVLIDRLEAGKKLEKLIPGSVFVSGSTKGKDRDKEYKDINAGDNRIVIATYGVAAVGLNIPRVFNLVMLEAGKSFTRSIQSIGRVLRKAKDKDSAVAYDLCSVCKFSKKHLRERKKYYVEKEYPNDIFKIDYYTESPQEVLTKIKQKKSRKS
jgi:superfamily II DNA or RNA helicase